MLPGINQIRLSMFGVLFMIKSFSSCSIEGQLAGKRFSFVKNAFKCPPVSNKEPCHYISYGLFIWREEDPRRRNNFSLGFIHSEILVCVSILLSCFVFRMVSHRVERKTRVTGDEAPSFARKFSSRERSGCEAGRVRVVPN